VNALVKLEGAVRMLAEAGTLEEVKHVHDIAQAAAEYARAARLGLEAQNYAAEIKLRAERKAGEMLAGLERQPGPGADTQRKRFPLMEIFCTTTALYWRKPIRHIRLRTAGKK
jgi:hypothetical protein